MIFLKKWFKQLTCLTAEEANKLSKKIDKGLLKEKQDIQDRLFFSVLDGVRKIARGNGGYYFSENCQLKYQPEIVARLEALGYKIKPIRGFGDMLAVCWDHVTIEGFEV